MAEIREQIMNRYTPFLSVLFAIVLVGPAGAMLSWVTVTGASIEQLDGDSYRLRVAVDWYGEDMQWVWEQYENYPTPPPIATPASFNYFGLTMLGDHQYNPTVNAVGWSDYVSNSPGLWQDEAYDNWGPWQAQSFDNTVFGYDFDLAVAPTEPFSLAFDATVDWSFRYDAVYHPYYKEYHAGRFSAAVIPEPASLILVGMGAAAIGFRLRRRAVSSR